MQIKKKEFFPAIDNLHLAIKASKGTVPEFYFELAKAYMDVNWFEEAISTIKSSITLYIKNGVNQDAIDKNYLLLAWVFEKQKDYDNALFNLTLISKKSPLILEAQVLKALISYKKGKIIDSKKILEEIYENYPDMRDNLTLLDSLGGIYKDLKLNAKAKEFFEKHLENFPESLHTACELVDLLIDMEDYDLAESYIEKYSSYGKVVSFLNSKARIYFRKKEYQKAIDELDELIKYDKNNAESYYFKGLIQNIKGEFEKASDNIQTALGLNPLPAKYYAQLAISYSGLKKYEEAMLFVKEAIEIEPNDLNYKELASEISEKAGKNTESAFWRSIVAGTESIIKDNQRL